MALVNTNLGETLPLVARGKVRDIYALPDKEKLLFVATDRISAYDVVMKNGIPNKGKILTALSAFWLNYLKDECPNHLIDDFTDLRTILPEPARPFATQLTGRCMVVHKLKVLPIEAIVRGYITGSAWSEYVQHGTVHGIKVPTGMRESQPFKAPLFTPSTKAEQGDHDENIHPDKMVEIIGKKHAKQIEVLALSLYMKARDYAAVRGIIIADTKFEFGLDDDNNLVLIDEVLTPDSSRFWPAASYEVGRPQDSYDKQYVRDWLTSHGLKGKDDVEIPEQIVRRTTRKYIEAYELLTGKKWTEGEI